MDTKISAIELNQNNKLFYICSMTSEQLVNNTELFTFNSQTKEGYQRIAVQKRAKAFADFIKGKKHICPTAILLSYRGEKPIFTRIRGDCGEIRLPNSEKLWQVDGQHRIRGLKELLENIQVYGASNEEFANHIKSLKFPVVIICPGLWNGDNAEQEDPTLLELLQFMIINSTQQKVKTDLAEQFLCVIKKKMSREDINALPRSVRAGIDWKPYAISVVEQLNDHAGAVWGEKIQLANAESWSGTYVNQKAFSDSIRQIVNSKFFPSDAKTSEEDRKKAVSTLVKNLENYWQAMYSLCEATYSDYTEYALFRRFGVFVMNKVLFCAMQRGYLPKSLVMDEITVNEFEKLFDGVPIMKTKNWSNESEWGKRGSSHKAVDATVDEILEQFKKKYGR